MLDGGYNDEFFSTNLPFPFPDALQEFSVQTSVLRRAVWQQRGRRGEHHHEIRRTSCRKHVRVQPECYLNARNFFAASRVN